MSVHRVEFLDGPLKGAVRFYDKRPTIVCQPIAGQHEWDDRQFVYEYDVSVVPTCGAWTARQKGMWVLDGYRKHWSQVTSAAREFGPTRRDYDELMRPHHRLQMREFMTELQALMDRYGVTFHQASGYEVDELASFKLGDIKEVLDSWD